MCKCKNVEMGSYKNIVILDCPEFMLTEKRKGGVMVDACIAEEIQGLWAKGIHTTNSCCGHNITEGFIGVIDSDIPRMKALGYVNNYNSYSFKLKTQF